MVLGVARVLTDQDEKAGALQAFIEKHQSERKFERIEPDSRLYMNALDETAVFQIKPGQIDFGMQTGQTLSKGTRELVISGLITGNRPGDLETAHIINLEDSKTEEEK